MRFDTNVQPPTIAQLRLICVALLAGVLIFAAITAFVLGNRGSGFGDSGLEIMVPIGVAVTVACTIAAFVARTMVWRSLRTFEGAAREQRYAAGVILFVAVLEGAMLLNIVVWLVSGQAFPTLLAAGFPFVVALLFGMPSEAQRDALVE